MHYVTYTDESYITDSRFRSICAFSFNQLYWTQVRSFLNSAITSSGITEFKWHKLKDAKYRFCAIKLINAALDIIDLADARLDIIIWDTQDSRHEVQGRDDAANFERMFYHLLRASMKRRPKGSRWNIMPDEKLDVDWSTVAVYLHAAGQRRQLITGTLWGDFFADPHYEITAFNQVHSHEHPCCQLADLMAGLAVFSKTGYPQYQQWVVRQSSTPGLFKLESVDFSNRQEYRYEVLKHLDSSCKKKKLGVSLRSNKCLTTPNPKKPVNFWHYTPQHPMDKAPTR